MSYQLTNSLYGLGEDPAGTQPAPGTDSSPMPSWAGPVIGVAVVGLIGLVIYAAVKHIERVNIIAEKEGSAGVLRMEAGEAAIGLGSALASRAIGGDHDRYRSNRRRSRRRSRR